MYRGSQPQLYKKYHRVLLKQQITILFFIPIVVISAAREAAKKVVKVEKTADDVCLEPDGYFPDSKQCDKYHACRY